MLKKKSISAIISVVLLILVTSVLVAGFLSWSKTTARDKLDVSQGELESASNMECVKYALVVESCNVDNSTSKISLLLRNPTPIDFEGLSLTLQGKSQGSNETLKIHGRFDTSINAGEIKSLNTDSGFTFITNDINIDSGDIIDGGNIKSFTLSTATCPKKTIDLKRCSVEMPAFEIFFTDLVTFDKKRTNISIDFNTTLTNARGTVACEFYQTIEGGSQVRMNPANTNCDISYTFTTAGTYEILLVANDDETTSSKTIYLDLWDAFSSSIATPVDGKSININKTFSLTSTIDNNMSTVLCDWSHKRSDLGTFTSFSSSCNTTLSLPSVNSYSIKLDTNDTGDSSTGTDTITVNILDNLSSSITALSRSMWNNNEAITFNGSYDNNTSAVTCEWISSLSDVNTSRGTNCSSLTYTFATTGSYTVYYKVTDTGTGDVATSSVSFTVVSPLTGTTSSPANSSVYSLSQSITFTVGSVNNLGSITYQWQYNRDGTGWTNFGTNSASITAGFATGGSYQFRVRLTDAGRPSPINTGYSNTITGVFIANPLSVSITSPTTGTNYNTSQTISFNSSVSNAVSGVSTYTWEYSTDQSTWIIFGGSVSNPTTSFATGGTRYIRLSVVDGASRSATSATINVVIVSPPLINITLGSLNSLSGWTTAGVSSKVDASTNGYTGIMPSNFWESGAFFVQGSTSQENVVVEGIVSVGTGANDTSKAGYTFNYSSTSASYACYLRNDYGTSGLYLEYGGSSLGSSVTGDWSYVLEGVLYNVKIEAFGSSKKCKFWQNGQSEPGSWNITVTNSSRNSGQWGGWTGIRGKVHSIKVTPY